MILRYYQTDWSIPCIENELLFVGTKEECRLYLLHKWSVDYKELESNPELRSTLCDYLHHIQISWGSFDEKNIDDILANHPNWDQRDWLHIDADEFIFNRELIEIVDSMPIDSDSDADTSIVGVFDYPMWEQVFEKEIYSEY